RQEKETYTDATVNVNLKVQDPHIGGHHFTWGTPLADRVDRPICGCRRRFDPISRQEISHCHRHPSTLFQLCRNIVLKSVGLTRIDLMTAEQLKVPLLVTKNICYLKISDFFIDPFKVQTSNVKEGIYRAKTTFSGKEVLLQISPDKHIKDKFKDQPDFLTSFQDQGVSCVLWEPTVTLWDMIKTHNRLCQPMACSFVWKIAQDVSAHIAACSITSACALDPTKVKISQSDGTVYVDKKSKFNPDWFEDSNTDLPPPPETKNLMHRLDQEKMYIWSLGCILLDMVIVLPEQQKKMKDGRKKLVFPCSQPRTLEEKLMVLKGFPESTLKSIIERSLKKNPSERPQAKEVLRIAREEVNKQR
ncbi:hypothetical protein EGW08_011640, partial [Elysia chlorotica]